jgi:hypothetical protein
VVPGWRPSASCPSRVEPGDPGRADGIDVPRPAGPSLATAFIVLIVLAGGAACVVPAAGGRCAQPLEALRHL